MNLESIKIELNELQNAVKAANSGGLMGKPDLIIFHLEKAETMVKGLLGGYEKLTGEYNTLVEKLGITEGKNLDLETQVLGLQGKYQEIKEDSHDKIDKLSGEIAGHQLKIMQLEEELRGVKYDKSLLESSVCLACDGDKEPGKEICKNCVF